MPLPVKISDRLLALAKAEAGNAHRSATAQIEHWATLGRAVEAMVAYRDMLALKRAGQTLPIPAHVTPEDVDDLVTTIVENADRESVKARIRAGGTVLYTTDPRYPGMVVEVRPDGTRTPGVLKGRQFIAATRKAAARWRSSTRPKRARSGG